MRIFKDFLIIFVPVAMAGVILCIAVVSYVASSATLGPNGEQAIAFAAVIASTSPNLGLISGTTTAPEMPTIAVKPPVVQKTIAVSTTTSSSESIVATSSTPVPPPPPPVLSATVASSNNPSNKFTFSAKTASALDTANLILSCPSGVSAVLSTDNVNRCNEPIVMGKNSNTFSATLVFTNAAANNLTIPITVLELNQAKIATSTNLSITLPPTGFIIANYKSLTLNNVANEYPADNSNQQLFWTETGYTGDDYGLLVLQGSSGTSTNNVPFGNYSPSVYIPSLTTGSVTFSLNQSTTPGTYRFAIIDDSNDQIAQSPYFTITPAATTPGSSPSPTPTTVVSLTSSGANNTVTVSAGANQNLSWNSNGASCTTWSNNTEDQSWNTAGTVSPQGTHVTPPLSAGSYTYNITCQDTTGLNNASASFTFNVQ